MFIDYIHALFRPLTHWQVFVNNVTQGTQDAADIVLVVDDSGSMRTEHEWLLFMVPLLEDLLVSAGIYVCSITSK